MNAAEIAINIAIGLIGSLLASAVIAAGERYWPRKAPAVPQMKAQSHGTNRRRIIWRRGARFVLMWFFLTLLADALSADGPVTRGDVLAIAVLVWLSLFLFVTALFGWHND